MMRIICAIVLFFLGCDGGDVRRDHVGAGAAGQGEDEGESETGPQDRPQRVCDPGRQVTCNCLGGAEGVQVCSDSGMRYDQCMCGPVREEADECTPLDTRACSCADRQEGVERCHARGYWTDYCECPVEPQEDLICDPGRTVTCPCGDGRTGVQDCNLDGRSYTPCRCPISEDPPDNGGGGQDIPAACEVPLKECDTENYDSTCFDRDFQCPEGRSPRWGCERIGRDDFPNFGCRPRSCDCGDPPQEEVVCDGIEPDNICDEDVDDLRPCEDEPPECDEGLSPREVCRYEDPIECSYFHSCECVDLESG